MVPRVQVSQRPAKKIQVSSRVVNCCCQLLCTCVQTNSEALQRPLPRARRSVACVALLLLDVTWRGRGARPRWRSRHKRTAGAGASWGHLRSVPCLTRGWQRAMISGGHAGLRSFSFHNSQLLSLRARASPHSTRHCTAHVYSTCSEVVHTHGARSCFSAHCHHAWACCPTQGTSALFHPLSLYCIGAVAQPAHSGGPTTLVLSVLSENMMEAETLHAPAYAHTRRCC